MTTMNIKDPEVHRLAHALAARRHVSATAAVREALQEALDRAEVDRSAMVEQLLALAAESGRITDPVLSDDDLYDERGLPR